MHIACRVHLEWIFQIIKYWNNAFVYDSHDQFKAKLEKMVSEAKAENCKQCGACEKMCPQQLPIREDLKRVCEYMKK